MVAERERGPTLTVLGSGTLAPDAARHGAAHLVEAGPVRLLMDCGWGTVDGLARHGVPWQGLTHVAVTHFHTDHVGDLSALLMALKHGVEPRRTSSLTLLGPVGFRTFLGALAGVLGSHLLDPGFPLEVVELAPGARYAWGEGSLAMTCHPTPHTEVSVAYRVEVSGAVVGYTGDTGASDSLAAFLAGCHVLVAECTQPDPPASAVHLSPTTLACLAEDAAPGILVVTHVAAPGSPEEAAHDVSRLWQGTVMAGCDGLRVPLPGEA